MILSNIGLFYTGACPNKSWDVFSGEKKRLRQNCWEYSPFYKGLEMGGMVLQKMMFDLGLCWDGFGISRDIYKNKNAN